MTRYILTGWDENGNRFSEAGLTAAQIEAAKVNAPRMGIRIDEILPEPELLSFSQMVATFSNP